MTKHPDILATITDEFGLKFSVPRLLQSVLRQIGAGAAVRIEVKKWYRKRTLAQNATAWGPDYRLILDYIARCNGGVWREEDLHDFHKRTFLGFDESGFVPGLSRPRSTADLSTVEFAEFRQKYCKYWAEMGLHIPDPEDSKS